jgi:hypothetical protein
MRGISLRRLRSASGHIHDLHSYQERADPSEAMSYYFLPLQNPDRLMCSWLPSCSYGEASQAQMYLDSFPQAAEKLARVLSFALSKTPSAHEMVFPNLSGPGRVEVLHNRWTVRTSERKRCSCTAVSVVSKWINIVGMIFIYFVDIHP